MKLYECCVICDSPSLSPYAMSVSPGAPHISRVKCKSCGIVFANPMAEEAELIEFYQNYYDKGNFEEIKWKEEHIEKFEAYETYSQEKLNQLFQYVLKHKTSGSFLDVGFGLGEPIFLANKHGFDVSGTEFDKDSIDFISGYVKDGNWHCGGLLDANFEAESFDFIRIWHVIEHLTDPTAYLNEIKRILKPGGILMVGTPDIGNWSYSIYRAMSFLMGKVPGIVDGMEHTVLYNKRTLSQSINSTGLEIVDHYTHAIKVNYKSLFAEEITFRKKIVRVLQSIFRINQALYARKS